MDYIQDLNGRVTRAKSFDLNNKKYQYIIISDIGQSREENQDSFLSVSFEFNNKAYILSLVCDGMGGYEHGKQASKTITDSVTAILSNIKVSNEQELLRAIEKAIRFSNFNIIEKYEGKSGSTITGVLFDGSSTYWWNVGDSRVYGTYLDNNEEKIKKLSKDHSLMQEQIDKGLLDEKDIKDYKKANILTRAIGTSPSVKIDFGIELNVKNMLICSDGFWHHTEKEELHNLLINESYETLVNTLDKQVDLLMERGENDNITVIMIKEEI